MSIALWVLIGLLAGLVSGVVVSGFGPLEGAIIGVVGSIIGGWLYAELTKTALTSIDLTGLGMALVGAVLFLVVARGLTQGRTAI